MSNVIDASCYSLADCAADESSDDSSDNSSSKNTDGAVERADGCVAARQDALCHR